MGTNEHLSLSCEKKQAPHSSPWASFFSISGQGGKEKQALEIEAFLSLHFHNPLKRIRPHTLLFTWGFFLAVVYGSCFSVSHFSCCIFFSVGYYI